MINKMSGKSKRDISSYWNRWAPIWDILLHPVRLDHKYREQGISVLNLKKGMTVLDIACGTGLNFPYLFQAVGPEGRIIAVDIAPKMLQKAKERAQNILSTKMTFEQNLFIVIYEHTFIC